MECESESHRGHPDVNDFFTGLRGLPKEQIRAKARDYLAANPKVDDHIRTIRQPTTDFRSRCDISGMTAGVPMAPQS